MLVPGDFIAGRTSLLNPPSYRFPANLFKILRFRNGYHPTEIEQRAFDRNDFDLIAITQKDKGISL